MSVPLFCLKIHTSIVFFFSKALNLSIVCETGPYFILIIILIIIIVNLFIFYSYL